MKRPFRWRSWLGVSVGLFLVYGVANLVAPLIVPTMLHLGGPGGAGGALVLGSAQDAALLGRSLDELGSSDGRLGTFLVTFMDTMCAQMMAFAIFQVAVVWFALRRGQRWALWAVLVSDLATMPYYVLIAATYASFGVPVADFFVGYLGFTIPLTVLPAFFGWLALREPSAWTVGSTIST